MQEQQQQQQIQPKFSPGERVRMFEQFGGVVLSYDADKHYYSVQCDYCEKEHLMFESDMESVVVVEEKQTHEPVRD